MIGPMATLSLSVDVGSVLLMARASAASDLAILSPPKSAMQDYSGLIGLVGREGPVRGYIAAGLGLANITRRGNEVGGSDSWPYYAELHDQVVNVPVQLGVSADLGSAGIGLALFGNVNSVLPDLGFALTISLGKLHD